MATNLDRIEHPGRRQTEIACWRRSWTLNSCSTHCLGWDPNQANHWVPNQANHWVPSPVPRQTPLWGRQDLRHCHTSVKLCPQLHPLTWPSLGCQPQCRPSQRGENALLNLAPGSPVKSSAPPGIGRGARVSGWSSCSDSPMSLGSSAVTSSLTLALKVHARALTPALLDDAKTDSSSKDSSSDKEDMDVADNSPREGTD